MNKPLVPQNDRVRHLAAGPLASLTALAQWCGWRWAQGADGKWQPSPVIATAPDRPASADDPETWCDYRTALAVAQARNVDGIAFVLTPADPFIAMDLGDCRHPRTRSIDIWAQNFLDVTREAYAEATPSGEGITIWGLTAKVAAEVNWKFALEIDGKAIAVELFRHTKILPVTGVRLDAVTELANIDKTISWALAWGDHREALATEVQVTEPAAAPKPAPAPKPEPKPAADVPERAPRPAPKPAPPAPTSPAPAGHHNGAHHVRARSSILFDLSEMTTIDLAELVDEPVPANRKICCPFHNETKPSLHIYLDHFYCFSCHAYGDHVDWLMRTRGLDHAAAQAVLTNWTGPVISQSRAMDEPTLEDIEKAEKNRAYVLKWWDAAKPIRGTLAETYLAETRGIDLDALPDNIDNSLRFHRHCIFGPGVTHPCLLALMRDPCGDAPIGIQRIALTPDAKKIDRMMLGKAGVVKIWPAGKQSVVGEGLETVLAAATRLPYRDEPLTPAWAALSDGGLKKFPLIDGVERLVVLADNDANNAGQIAAETCKRRWLEANRRVALLTPDRLPDRPNTDFNDIVLANLGSAP